MKTNIYGETTREVCKLFLECFQDVKEEVEDFIQKVPNSISAVATVAFWMHNQTCG